MFLEKITLFFSGGILSYYLDTFSQIYPKNHHNLWRKIGRKCPVCPRTRAGWGEGHAG
jgi:hypothetical protein